MNKVPLSDLVEPRPAKGHFKKYAHVSGLFKRTYGPFVEDLSRYYDCPLPKRYRSKLKFLRHWYRSSANQKRIIEASQAKVDISHFCGIYAQPLGLLGETKMSFNLVGSETPSTIANCKVIHE